MDFNDLATRVARHVAQLTRDAQALDQDESIPEATCQEAIRLDAATLSSLAWGFASDAGTWTEFQRAVETIARASDQFRSLLHWEILYKLSSLASAQRQLAQIECVLAAGLSPDQRQSCETTLAGARQHMDMVKAGNLHQLALRLNQQAGEPVTDGVALQVLAQVMGDDPALWREFAAAVEPVSVAPGERGV